MAEAVDVQGSHRACVAQGADCVWHIAALVGPYYEHKAYYDVNYTCASTARATAGLSACQRSADVLPCSRRVLAAAARAAAFGTQARAAHAAVCASFASAAQLRAHGVGGARSRPQSSLAPRPVLRLRRGTLNVIEACKRLNVRACATHTATAVDCRRHCTVLQPVR